MTSHWDKYNEGKHDFAKEKMTDAEKAMHRLKHSFGVYKDVSEVDADLEIINQALQRAAVRDKAYEGALIQSDSYKNAIKLVNKQADDLEAENKSLKDKAQGLLKALEMVQKYHLPAWDADVVNKAIAAFGADDLGVK